MTAPGLMHSVRRIVPLAWPVFIGQIAVLAFGTVDTMLAARHSATDLAALAIGGAAYISVYIGLMGVVLAVGPIVGQLYGAGRLAEAGRQLHQAIWVALALSLPGCTLLLWPEPFLKLAQAPADVADKARDYLAWLALALPPALVFTAFRGFNNALSRPKVVMALQLGALALKVPLSVALVFGLQLGPLHLPDMGAAGCGLATALVMLAQLAAAVGVLRRDPFYARFGLQREGPGGRRLAPLTSPDRASMAVQLRLGVPMGASIMVEVTGFTFMAFFISRIGTTAVAGHQLAANLAGLLYMLPMAWANATGTLVAQSLGARRYDEARRLGWHGVQSAMAVAALLGLAVYLGRGPILRLYTGDDAIVAAALPLLAWMALFHFGDATQAVVGFVMRAYHVAVAPFVIYALAIWGVGLAGGYVLAFDVTGLTPAAMKGAPGFWVAGSVGLASAALGLMLLMRWVVRMRAREPARNAASG